MIYSEREQQKKKKKRLEMKTYSIYSNEKVVEEVRQKREKVGEEEEREIQIELVNSEYNKNIIQNLNSKMNSY